MKNSLFFPRTLPEFFKGHFELCYVIQYASSLSQFHPTCTFNKKILHQLLDLSSSCFSVPPLFSTETGLETSATMPVNSQEEDCKAQSTLNHIFFKCSLTCLILFPYLILKAFSLPVVLTL